MKQTTQRYFARWIHRVFVIVTLLLIGSRVVHSQEVPADQIRALAWNPDGMRLAAGYQDGRIEILSLDPDQPLLLLQDTQPYDKSVLALSWHPGGRYLASGDTGYLTTLKIWDTSTGEAVLTVTDVVLDILVMSWSPDGTKLIVGSAEAKRAETGSTLVVNLESFEVSSIPTGAIGSIAWSEAHSSVVVGRSTSIRLLDTNSFATIMDTPISQERFRNLQNQPVSTEWHPGGLLIAVGMGDGRVFIYSGETLAHIETLIAHDYDDVDRLTGFVYGLAFDADGGTLTAISGTGTIRTWETETWALVSETRTTPNYEAVFSPYGGRVAISRAPEAVIGSLPTTASAYVTDEVGNGTIQIIVPDPSLDRLNGIAEACVPESAARDPFVADSLAEVGAFVERLDALPDDAIPPGCRADLLAVAEALLAEAGQ